MRLAPYALLLALALPALAPSFAAEPPVAPSAKPVPVVRVPPVYPATAESIGLLGDVQARLKIDAEGRVVRVEIVNENPAGFDFAAAANAALTQWSFKPGQPGNFPVSIHFAPPAGTLARTVDQLPTAPKVVSRVKPVYPMKAESKGSQGVVNAVVIVGVDGAPADVRVLAELPEDLGFGNAALASLSRWRFEPAHPGPYTVTVHFMMHNQTPGISWQDLKLAPEPTSRIAPILPSRAVENDRSGNVKLAIAIEPTGRVSSINVVTEKPKDYGFGDAAKAAVEQWRFEGAAPGIYRLTVTMSPP